MQSKIDKEAVDRAYEPLRELLTKYGTRYYSPTNAELDEILEAASMVSENFSELYTVRCDVLGCNEIAVCGGVHYRDSGYWNLCEKGANDAIKGLSKPLMKPEAIEREANRKPDGTI